jgi:hypothetical protein
MGGDGMSLLDHLWCLEYSEYSESVGMCPWHLDLLNDALSANLDDFFNRTNGKNKWQMVCVGTREKCVNYLELLTQAEREPLALNQDTHNGGSGKEAHVTRGRALSSPRRPPTERYPS